MRMGKGIQLIKLRYGGKISDSHEVIASDLFSIRAATGPVAQSGDEC